MLPSGHIAGWSPRLTASHAIDFTRLAGPLLLCSPRVEEDAKIAAEDQHRSPVVVGRESALHPVPHGVPVNPKQARDLFHAVVPVDLGKARVRVALTHGAARPRCSFATAGAGIGVGVFRGGADTFRTRWTGNRRNRRNRFHLPGFRRAVAAGTHKAQAADDATGVPPDPRTISTSSRQGRK